MTKTTAALLAGTAAGALIQTTAKAHGTFNSPTNGTILYVDPDHSEERYHSPKLTPAEAAAAHERGLIEDYDVSNDAVTADDRALTERDARDPNAIGTVSATHTEQFAKQDDEGGPGSGTLDSRQSTAWPDRARVEGAAHGFTDGVRQAPAAIDEVSGDDDAPPAPAPRRRKAAGEQ